MTDASQATPPTAQPSPDTPPAEIPDGPQGDFDGFGPSDDADLNSILEAFGRDPTGSTQPAAEPPADPATPAAPAAPAQEATPPSVAPAPAATPTPSPTPTPPSAAPAATPSGEAATPPVSQPADPAAPPAIPQELLLASLQAQVATLTQQLQEAGQQPAATPSAATPPAAGSEEPAAPAHSLSVPQEVVAALFGEDGAQAHNALNHVLSSMANYIHKSLRAEYAPLIDSRVNALRTELATREGTSTAEQVRVQQQEQYYTAFPAHKNAILTPLIAQAAGEVFAELPHAVWNDQTIAVIGTRVNHKLTQLGMQPPAVTEPVPAAPTPTTPAATGVPQPAPMLPTAPAAQAGGDAADEILETFKV